MEQLLTQQEIDYILDKAEYSWLNHPAIFSKITKGPLDIFSISPEKKLIFVEGDKDTGLKHIQKRHGFYSNEHSKTQRGFFKTSRFSLNTGPFIECVKICEALYAPQHLDVKGNKNPELFDVYKGSLSTPEKREYRLILYKGTKIVHTLFPLDKKSPVIFRKGDLIWKRYDEERYTAVIPYYDINDQVRYGIGIIMNIPQKTEEWFIYIYENNVVTQKADLGKQKQDFRFNIEVIFQAINFVDVTQIEDLILKIETGEVP